MKKLPAIMLKEEMKWKLSLPHLQDSLKVINNGFYSFFISYFVLELFRLVWYVNDINYDVELCIDHCKLLGNHVYHVSLVGLVSF